jgi:hypothetical protein
VLGSIPAALAARVASGVGGGAGLRGAADFASVGVDCGGANCVCCGEAGASETPAPAPVSSITANGAPTSTVSSTAAKIFPTTPAQGEGISTSTLSVVNSTIIWSKVTVSPSLTNHRATVPSITLSPRLGTSTETDIEPHSCAQRL